MVFFISLIFLSILIKPYNAISKIKPPELPSYIEFAGDRLELSSNDLKERLEVRYYAYFRAESQMILWMKRSKRFFPVIEKILKENDIPTDLKYMTVVESALIPRSYSPKNAVGIWQFVKYTGKRHGLTVNKRYDERRDVYKATQAAADYLNFLYNKFGSWYLAMAAYNIGENRVAREVKEQGTDNFFEMVFPRETDEYVINVLIVKHMMEHPKLYNLDIEEDEYFVPYNFKEVKITVGSGKVPISVIARASYATFREIKNLNPQIISNYLYKGTYSVRIPPEGKHGFDKRVAELYDEYKKDNRFIKVVEKIANLREGPGTQYKSIKSARKGTKFKFLSTSQDLYKKKPWYEIEFKDDICWVWSGLVDFVD